MYTTSSSLLSLRHTRVCALLSERDLLLFPVRQDASGWNRAQPQRLPRECGGPVDDKFLAEDNSCLNYVIDLFEELFIHWIPAFARKTLWLSRFAQQALYALNHAFRTRDGGYLLYKLHTHGIR